MRNPLQVAVVGVTGYTGLELARILFAIPRSSRQSSTCANQRCELPRELFPQFRGWGEAPLRPLSVDAITSSNAGTAFLATPHEVSAELAPALLQAGLRVVDLSGAFRFRETEISPPGTNCRRHTLPGFPRPSTVFPSCTPAKLPRLAGGQPRLLCH